MQVVHEVCCGLDVHKKGVTGVCLGLGGGVDAGVELHARVVEFGRLAARLWSTCSMEFHGRVLEAVWNLLEGQF